MQSIKNVNFNFSFYGREARAIGICYQITITIIANNLCHAIEQLYDSYDISRNLKVNGKSLPFGSYKFEGNTCIYAKPE